MTTTKSAPGDETGGAKDEQRDSGNVVSIVRRRRDWRAVWAPMRLQAHTTAQDRRARVLAHPDLADQLTIEPIGYERPGQWNGYVPPDLWQEQRNDSSRRAALVELCAEALRREGGGEWA